MLQRQMFFVKSFLHRKGPKLWQYINLLPGGADGSAEEIPRQRCGLTSGAALYSIRSCSSFTASMLSTMLKFYWTWMMLLLALMVWTVGVDSTHKISSFEMTTDNFELREKNVMCCPL